MFLARLTESPFDFKCDGGGEHQQFLPLKRFAQLCTEIQHAAYNLESGIKRVRHIW